LAIGILICGRGGGISSPLRLEGILGNERKGVSSPWCMTVAIEVEFLLHLTLKFMDEVEQKPPKTG